MQTQPSVQSTSFIPLHIKQLSTIASRLRALDNTPVKDMSAETAKIAQEFENITCNLAPLEILATKIATSTDILQKLDPHLVDLHRQLDRLNRIVSITDQRFYVTLPDITASLQPVIPNPTRVQLTSHAQYLQLHPREQDTLRRE